jgi:signal transduction histidine kinase/ligand-binding sensor domain-containing protein/DNA-binding response OmpR family regulator
LKKKYNYILLFIIGIGLPRLSLGQATEAIQFRSFGMEAGLSNESVSSILKDEDGFMWLGTAHGLNRYDGTTIRQFVNQEFDSTSLSKNYIEDIFEGPEGNIWIRNSGLVYNVYLKREEIFCRNMADIAHRYQLKSSRVRAISKDAKGRFWFIHPHEGISVYDPVLKNTEHLYQGIRGGGGLSNNMASAVGETVSGDMWVVYENGVIDVLDPKEFRVKRQFSIESFLESGISYQFSLFMDSEGDGWIFSPFLTMGAFLVERISGEVTHYTARGVAPKLNNGLVKTIMEFKEGQIWLGTDHGGINIVDKQSGNVSFLMHDPDDPKSLSHNAIYDLYQDEKGTVWVGTFSNGVNLYHRDMGRFAHHKRKLGPSLPHNDINSFLEDPHGNVYIGTNGVGLYYWDRKKNEYLEVLDEEGKSSLGVIVDMAMDQDGILWMGTYQQGLYGYDGKTFQNYLPNLKNPNGLRDVNIWSVFVDSKNRIWLGTLNEGLHLFNKQKGTFRNFSIDDKNFPTNNSYVVALEEDKYGNIWVGGGDGIDILNLETGDHKYYSGGTMGLTGSQITDIHRDASGTMWVSTTKGLNIFDEMEDSFVSFTKADGLPSQYIVSILEDDSGHLWVSSQHGLGFIEVDRKEFPYSLAFRQFNLGDGLQGLAFSQNSALKTEDGHFLFGGANGFNIFKMDDFRFRDEPPKVVFTEFQLFNKTVSVNETVNGRVLLESPVQNTKGVELKHYENIFSVAFSSLNFLHPEKTQFQYKLVGFNEEWTTLENPPFSVTYTNLDPGTYQLLVRATNDDGQWSKEEHSFFIHILTPYWQSPFAYLFYFLVAIAAALLVVKWFLDKEKEKLRRAEEKKENRRIQELDKLKTRFFTNISHEFRTPLSLILSPAEQLMKCQFSEGEKEKVYIIHRNAKRLLHLVDQLLDIKNIEKEGVKFAPSNADVVAFLRERVDAFKSLSSDKHIKLHFQCDENLLVAPFDGDKLEKIIFNLLSNAFKFTPEGGEVSVKGKFIPSGEDSKIGVFEVEVKDNGIGIDEMDLPNIFERYYVGKESKRVANSGTGIGLSLSLDFARLHGGDIKVFSKKGNGAAFVLTLPVEVLEREPLPVGESQDDMDMASPKPGLPTLMVVDDNPDFLLYLGRSLSFNFQVITARNGAEALEKSQKFMPDLIISDLMMPVMDGAQLCRRVKGDIKTSHIPVILLTARSSEEKQLEGLGSGCNLYLTKPFNFDLLLLSVNNLLQERAKLQELYQKKISAKASEEEIVSLDDLLIRDTIRLVEKNLDNPELTVEQLSRELGMSRVHFYKKIHSLTGKSPVTFIRSIRLEHAKQLLQRSQLTVSEIAFKVGYNNAKYFSKHFKAEYGKLPSQVSKAEVEG